MKIKVGDQLWIPKTGNQQVKTPCLVCFGDKEVVVILGNGSHVKTQCGYCRSGYDSPSGYMMKYVREPGAELFIVNLIRTKTTATGEASEYVTASGRYAEGEKNLYQTEEEAVEASKELREKQLADDEKRASSIKKDAQKSFSWNVGYHMRQVKRLNEDIKYHERMAVLCEARVRKK